MNPTTTTRLLLPPAPELPLTLTEAGAGRPVVVLHGGAGPASVADVVDHLAADHLVLAPTHPGWDGTERPGWFTGVDSLAVTYLDLLDDRDLIDVTVLGSSFGGWVAAEMAVRDRGRRISRLVLMDGLGPEVPGHEVAVPPVPPAAGRPAGPPPAGLVTLDAYTGGLMNDPKLARRLARVDIPTLVVWGENDPVVTADFGRAYAATFPHARVRLIPGAGHLPARDAPDTTLGEIDTFLSAT